jgi:F420-dependent oxidoreductase-like protein
MRLGVSLNFGSSAEQLAGGLGVARAADEIGYDCVWVAEAFGSDAVSVLGAVAARTERIGLGAGVLQIPARAPAATGMAAATLDALSGGRFRLGLGVSGPQVSEGWYGVAFADPVGRTREYLAIVRDVTGRRRVAADGRHFTLPLPGGEGKSLVLALQPVRRSIPIYLAALGPRNLDLLGEVADGWLGIFADPATARTHIDRISASATAAGRDPGALDFGVQLQVAVDDDVEAAARSVAAHAAYYIGGMGSRSTNFYHRTAASMGYAEQADRIQELFLSRDRVGAAAAVPTEFLDAVSLLGSPERIAGRLAAYQESGVTSVNINVDASRPEAAVDVLRAVHEAAVAAGVIDAGVAG